MASPEDTAADADLGFAWRADKSGAVTISRRGRIVTVLRGAAARTASVRLAGLDPTGQQQLMARLTGHYRQGTERVAARHPRNR